MPREKKLPTGVYKKGDKYATRPYNRITKKKSTEQLFDTPEQADQYRKEYLAKNADPAKAGWTVSRYAEKWTTHPSYQRPSQSSNIHNHERISHFVETYGDVLMQDITRDIARDYSEEHPSRLSAIRAMFSDAVADDIVERNVWTKLRSREKKSTGRKHLDVPTEPEVRKLIEMAYEKWPDWPFYGSFIAVAAYTGMRIGELLAIRWSDIDWEKGVITVERQWNTKLGDYTPTKNGQVREIEMLPDAQEALRILPKDGPDGLVWRSPRGSKMVPNLHFYYWTQVRAQWLGSLPQERYERLKDIDFHTLRHFTASWLVDMNIPPADVAYQLGHTDGGYLIQNLYGHRYPENSRSRIRQGYNQARAA